MTDTTYRIFHRESDGFVVEVIRQGALPQTATGFETEAAAQGWIAQDQRLWAAADPFRPAGSRRWKGY